MGAAGRPIRPEFGRAHKLAYLVCRPSGSAPDMEAYGYQQQAKGECFRAGDPGPGAEDASRKGGRNSVYSPAEQDMQRERPNRRGSFLQSEDSRAETATTDHHHFPKL